MATFAAYRLQGQDPVLDELIWKVRDQDYTPIRGNVPWPNRQYLGPLLNTIAGVMCENALTDIRMNFEGRLRKACNIRASSLYFLKLSSILPCVLQCWGRAIYQYQVKIALFAYN